MSEAAALQTQTTQPPPSHSHSLLVQRKCACGGSSGLTGSCSECEKKKLLGQPLQTKLRINEPGDEYEQEADRVAEHVMRMPDPHLKPENPRFTTTPLGQRRVTEGNTGVGEAPLIVHDVLSSPGEPLDATTRAFFEPRFGHDFSSIRIYADRWAQESASAINARAYTFGHGIVFGAGQYAPSTSSGRHLLAHELAHVTQQGSDAKSVIQRTRWFRGEGKDVPPATDREHDVGSGQYWTNEVAVGAQYTYQRGADDRARGIRLLLHDSPELSQKINQIYYLDENNDRKLLGKVLNVNADPKWHETMDEVPQELRHQIAGEVYTPCFADYLGLEPGKWSTIHVDAKLEELGFMAVIAPEYRLGGLQMVILNSAPEEFRERVSRNVRPVIADLSTEVIGPTGEPVEAEVIGTQSRVLNVSLEGAVTTIDLEIRELANISQSMKARFQIDPKGIVVAIEVLEGPPALVEAYARQIAANASARIYEIRSFRSSPPGGAGPSGGVGLGVAGTLQLPGQESGSTSQPPRPQLPVRVEPPTSAKSTSSPGTELVRWSGPQLLVRWEPSTSTQRHGLGAAVTTQITGPGSAVAPRSLGAESGAAPHALLGGALLANVMARKLADAVAKFQTQKAQDEVNQLVPQILSELEKRPEMGVIITVAYSQPIQDIFGLDPERPRIFLWASFDIVPGLTLSEAKSRFRTLYPNPDVGELRDYRYQWIPPLNSTESPQNWHSVQRRQSKSGLQRLHEWLQGK
jgi:hypothetical protein